MTLLKLRITAKSPLAFPERKAGTQFRRSLGYIPGASIYGALGTELGTQYKHEKDTFKQLFHSLRCHNAYPAWPDDPWSRPLPMTAMAPKATDQPPPPQDMLIERVCYERLQPAALIFSPTDDKGRVWETVTGFYAPPGSDDVSEQVMRKVDQRVFTRVAINRRRGTAEDQLLYSPLALSEVNTSRVYHWEKDTSSQQEIATSVKDDFWSLFLGSVTVPDGNSEVIQAVAQITRLGGRSTSGMGLVEVNAEEREPETATEIQQRVEQLTARFTQRIAWYEDFGSNEEWHLTGSLFTITLLSDAILYEKGWLPTMVLTSEMLQEATRVYAQRLGDSITTCKAGIEATLVRSFAAYGVVGGWNVMWNTHKPAEISTQMGSVFLFSTTQPLDADACTLLAMLQQDGIGERRAEGYGQLRVCDEFHMEYAWGGTNA